MKTKKVPKLMNEFQFEKEYIKRCEAKYGFYLDTEAYKFIVKLFAGDRTIMRRENIVKVAQALGECIGVRINREQYRTLKGTTYWFQENLDSIKNFCRGKKITLYTKIKPLVVQF